VRLVSGPGVAGVVKDRRFTGAAAHLGVEIDGGVRVEVLADPRGPRVGDRVMLAAERKSVFTGAAT